MSEKSTPDRKSDPARLGAMENRSVEVMIILTREEVKLRDCVTAGK